MNESLGMHIIDALNDFPDNNRSSLFLKFSLDVKDVEEVPLGSKFHEEVDPIPIIKEIV